MTIALVHVGESPRSQRDVTLVSHMILTNTLCLEVEFGVEEIPQKVILCSSSRRLRDSLKSKSGLSTNASL